MEAAQLCPGRSAWVADLDSRDCFSRQRPLQLMPAGILPYGGSNNSQVFVDDRGCQVVQVLGPKPCWVFDRANDDDVSWSIVFLLEGVALRTSISRNSPRENQIADLSVRMAATIF